MFHSVFDFRTAIESNDAVEFLRNYRFPYQQRRLFQGPNVQVDYRPLVNEAQSDDGSFYLNDELPQQETIKLDDNIELVTPSYVGNVLLMPHGHVEQARYIKPGDRSFEDELNDESSEPEVSLRNEEFADIPTQDVGEQEEQLGSRSELLRADESQNVAYSYSNFIPHYQPVPRQFHFGMSTALSTLQKQLNFVHFSQRQSADEFHFPSVDVSEPARAHGAS